MGDIEKIAIYVQNLFHGIVSTYLFYTLTDVQISEFYFTVLIVFFSYLNILLFRAFITMLNLAIALHLTIRIAANEADLEISRERKEIFSNIPKNLRLSTDDINYRPALSYFFVFYFLTSIFSGYTSSYIYQYNLILSIFHHINWPKETNRNPLEQQFFTTCNLSNSDCNHVSQYIKIWWKDNKFLTAGYIKDLPTNNEKYWIKLSPSCEILVVANGDKGAFDERVLPRNGNPASYINLDNPSILAIEVLQDYDPCGN